MIQNDDNKKAIAKNESKLQYKKGVTDNLEFHGLSLQLNSADLEINSNSTDVALRVGIVRETQKQTGLELLAVLFENRTFNSLPCQHRSHR